LALAGTVPVPTPYPEVGRLSLVPGGLVYDRTREQVQEDLVVIEHLQSNRVLVRRSLLLRDLAAVVFVPVDRGENWFFGPEIGKELAARSNSNRDDLLMGIAYAREQAPVLLEVEVGMTAAESAEYYPPAVGEPTDDHYTLEAGRPGMLDCDTSPPQAKGSSPRDCDIVRPPPPGARTPRDCEGGSQQFRPRRQRQGGSRPGGPPR
jgi:hypothetical protein